MAVHSLTLLFLCGAVGAVAATNTTASNHDGVDLFCHPSSITDILIFFLGNYVAHAATVIPVPAEPFHVSAFRVLGALLIPTTGIVVGIQAIASLAIFGRDDLTTAARAGALCTIIKTWDGRIHQWPSFNDRVHGVVDIPELYKNGYALVYVSTRAEFEQPDFESYEPPSMPGKKGVQIASNYNATKILISLGQTLYSVFTLYQTRGDQVTRYGYTAFGLTVAPFAVMSTVNLLGNLMVPTYPKMYVVESAGLRKAREEGIYIDGVVGRLVETEKEKKDFCLDPSKTIAAEDFSRKPTIWQYAVCTVVSVIPLFINYGISGLEPRSSSLFERVWTLLWLASCIAFATFYTTLKALRIAPAPHFPWPAVDFVLDSIAGSMVVIIFILKTLIPVVGAVSAVGTFIMVGRMIRENGICVRVI